MGARIARVPESSAARVARAAIRRPEPRAAARDPAHRRHLLSDAVDRSGAERPSVRRRRRPSCAISSGGSCSIRSACGGRSSAPRTIYSEGNGVGGHSRTLRLILENDPTPFLALHPELGLAGPVVRPLDVPVLAERIVIHRGRRSRRAPGTRCNQDRCRRRSADAIRQPGSRPGCRDRRVGCRCRPSLRRCPFRSGRNAPVRSNWSSRGGARAAENTHAAHTACGRAAGPMSRTGRFPCSPRTSAPGCSSRQSAIGVVPLRRSSRPASLAPWACRCAWAP